MYHKTPGQQLVHFRRTLTEWRWMLQLSEYPDEVVRLLNIDARKLGEMAVEHPDLAMGMCGVDGRLQAACS
jgi:hypothetical protein